MADPTPFVVGVDGGGTKTAVVAADLAGHLLGRGSAGSSNYQKVGFDNAGRAIEDALAIALAEAGRPSHTPAALCLGLSGVDRREDQALWEAWLHARFPGSHYVVVNDAELPLAAGTPDGWGVGVICGTGAICVGRNREGQMARADGWGFLLGDDGSGYAIGREAMRAVLRAVDRRGPPTTLQEQILAHWSLQSPEAILDRVYLQDAGPAENASLAAVVNRCAEDGDAVAQSILREAGRQLALTIAAVVRTLGLETGPVPCALAGSVVNRSRLVAEQVQETAIGETLRLDPVTMVEHPVDGAVRLARSLVR